MSASPFSFTCPATSPHFLPSGKHYQRLFLRLVTMCMLFAFLNPEATRDEFALIVASIRDEYFSRPTREASFWREDNRIIGGELYLLSAFLHS